ncbi:MAG: hypothetical protein Q8Q25_01965 [bacterium]|nr:hypothetical protein [bacterium]
MKTFGFFDPIVYAFRAFFKHIWLMFLCIFAIVALGICTTLLLMGINWPILTYASKIMQQAQHSQMGAGMMSNIDVVSSAGMPSMGFSTMNPEMMKHVAIKFLPYLIVSGIVLTILGAWIWSGLCAVALEIRDKDKSSVKNFFAAIRFVPKVWLSYMLWGIPLFLIIFLLLFITGLGFAGMMAAGARTHWFPLQFIIFLFLVLSVLPFMFVNFYIIDKKNGPIAALYKSFLLTQSGGFKAYGALFLLLTLLFLFSFIPILGHYIGALLNALGLAYIYRKLA